MESGCLEELKKDRINVFLVVEERKKETLLPFIRD